MVENIFPGNEQNYQEMMPIVSDCNYCQNTVAEVTQPNHEIAFSY